MKKSFYLTALASILILSSYAQDACCSQPTVVQVNADGTQSVLVNIPYTSVYINPENGLISVLPCNTFITYDPSPRSNAQPHLSFNGQQDLSSYGSLPSLSRSPSRFGHNLSPRKQKNTFKTISIPAKTSGPHKKSKQNPKTKAEE